MSLLKRITALFFCLSITVISAQEANNKTGNTVAHLLELAKKNRQTSPQMALQAIDSALVLLARDPNEEQAVLLYYYQAITFIAIGEYQQAINAGEQSLVIATKLKNESLQTYGLNAVGQAHYNLNELDRASQYFEQEIEIYRRTGDESSMTSPLLNLGNINQFHSKFNQAIQYYLEAVRIQEASGKPNCLMYVNVAVLYNNLQQHDQELTYSRRGVGCAKKSNNKLTYIRNKIGLLTALVNSQFFDEALATAQEAESLLDGTEYQRERLFMLTSWGKLNLIQNQYQSAVTKLQSAYQIAQNSENTIYRIEPAHLLSRAYIKTQQWPEAEKYALDALEIAQTVNIETAKREALTALSQIYYLQGNYQKAYQYLDQHSELNQKLVEQERSQEIKQRSQQISELETQYQVEQKEKAITQLEKDNALQQLETESQKNKRYLWTIVLLLLSFILFVLYFLQRQHKKLAAQETAMMELSLTKKNDLIANISHEFRTPITLITGPLQRLLQTGNETERKTYKGIMNNAQRLLRMVDQILDLAKFEQAPVTQIEFINLIDIVEHLLLSMESLFEQHQLKITLNKEIPIEALPVRISTDTAEKIIINLLTNAVKYTPTGGSITIYCGSTCDNEVLFSVTDSGVGISAEDQTKVFDRFVRLDSAKQGAVPGAGIGLALVKELVQHNGGRITLKSTLGKGSEFSVTFPSIQHAEINSTQLTQLSKIHIQQEIELLKANRNLLNTTEIPVNIGSRKQVLIVEDNQEMQSFISECLTHYDCHFANNGIEGIQKALELIPDLVVTDLMMPLKNGYQVAETLRDDHRTSHIPIIMLTAKADNTSRMQAWRSDIDEFLSKPFSPEELQLRTHNLLSIRTLMSYRLAQYSETVEPNRRQKVTSSRWIGLSDKDRFFIEKVDQYLAKHYNNNNIQLNEIYAASNMSERQFRRKMKALTQQNLTDYLKVFRLKKGADLLQKGEQITEVAYKIGFSSSSYFSQCFKAHFGLSPSDYLNQ